MAETHYQIDVRDMGGFSAHALYELLKLRVDVFIVEQNCAYPELDGKDIDALHVRLLDADTVVAATRILKPQSPEKPVKIGRVVVAASHRGKRLGERIMRDSIVVCEDRFPDHDIFLSAQSHLSDFYESFGFKPVSVEYLEDGIPHIDMVRRVGEV